VQRAETRELEHTAVVAASGQLEIGHRRQHDGAARASAGRPGRTRNGYAGDFTDSTYPRTSAAGSEYAVPSASSMSLMNCSIRGVNS